MQRGFRRNVLGELVYYIIPMFEQTGLVRHCFTTRRGGVSTGETASLNLGFRRRDTSKNIRKNYRIVAEAIDVDETRMVLSDQVHGCSVRVVTEDDCGKGIVRESDIKAVDALVCRTANVPLVTFYADCVPLFFLDPKTKTIALAHSGWRSTVQRIGVATIETMRELGCCPKDILVGIGPSIGPCHFEVDGDVAVQFDSRFVSPRGEKFYVDLWSVIADQMTEAGIAENHITLAGICTCCHSDEFFSYRADGGKTGSLAAVMQLV